MTLTELIPGKRGEKLVFGGGILVLERGGKLVLGGGVVVLGRDENLIGAPLIVIVFFLFFKERDMRSKAQREAHVAVARALAIDPDKATPLSIFPREAIIGKATAVAPKKPIPPIAR